MYLDVSYTTGVECPYYINVLCTIIALLCIFYNFFRDQFSCITAVIQPEVYNMYNCVSKIMKQDCTATRSQNFVFMNLEIMIRNVNERYTCIPLLSIHFRRKFKHKFVVVI